MAHVLSERARKNVDRFLDQPASAYDASHPDGNDPYGRIMDWACDPDYGGLSRWSGLAFAAWLRDAWPDFLDGDDDTIKVKAVLEGAVSDWCGGRVMPV